MSQYIYNIPTAQFNIISCSQFAVAVFRNPTVTLIQVELYKHIY